MIPVKDYPQANARAMWPTNRRCMTDEMHYLLTTLAEECGETIKHCCKALRFGIDGFAPDRPTTTNADGIYQEFCEAMAVFELLIARGYLPATKFNTLAKQEVVLRWMQHSELLYCHSGDDDERSDIQSTEASESVASNEDSQGRS